MSIFYTIAVSPTLVACFTSLLRPLTRISGIRRSVISRTQAISLHYKTSLFDQEKKRKEKKRRKLAYNIAGHHHARTATTMLLHTRSLVCFPVRQISHLDGGKKDTVEISAPDFSPANHIQLGV